VSKKGAKRPIFEGNMPPKKMYPQNLRQYWRNNRNPVNIKRQIYYAHRQKNVLNQITYTVCTQNWIHFLHFSENSQRHHYAADPSVYLVNSFPVMAVILRPISGVIFLKGHISLKN
jgi:hypothetical protein